MKSITPRIAVVAWLLLPFLSQSARAENNSNLVFNATTNDFGGSLVIGNTGTNNSLQIYNAGVVSNTTATVGSGAGASNNFVIVSDLNSTWSSSGALTLGAGGGNNQLTITNGGRVESLHAFIGASDNNTVLVTGSGSLYSLSASGSFEVGFGGKNNTMTIASGGRVSDSGGYIGAGGSNATVVVNGGIWTNTSSMNLGYTSPYNQLFITNGGSVYSAGGNVGGTLNISATNAGNCSVLVSDLNSLWYNNGALLIGDFAGQNTLIVSNNAVVTSTSGSVGKANAASSNNTVLVTGPGSVWTNSGTLTVGDIGGSNRFEISDHASAYGTTFVLGNNAGNNSLSVLSGGRLNGSSATIGSIGANSGSNTVLVSGNGSVWTNSAALTLGSGGGNNQMTISNGGRVDALNVSMGVSDNNTLTVTGTNSLFSTPASSFVVGGGGKNNSMTIADGGQVANKDGYIGLSGVAGSNNTVVVNGGVWTNTSTLDIGYASPNSRLIVTNGGKVYNVGGFLGGNAAANANAVNNSVLVSDSNSLWKSTSDFSIGSFAGGNSLTVSNGGQAVVVGTTKVGANAGSGTNTVLVTGAGSLWTNNGAVTFGTGAGAGVNSLSVSSTGQVVMVGAFTLGNSSGGNSLSISSGGQVVVVGASTLGLLPGSDGNTVLVTGAGSAWSNTSSIALGNASGGRNNQMTISNGGRVDASFFANTTANNTLTVTGTNSLFNTPGSFVIGNAGTNNLMTIADGGKVANADGYIGFGGVADSNNTVVVSGGVWTNGSTLDIGYSSPNSRLIVTNGGKVYDNGGTLSFIGGAAVANTNAGNNSVLVSGTNSLWMDNGGFTIGKFAGGNSLTVSNGGQVVVLGTTSSKVGVSGALSGSNTVLVTGAGSVWTNANAIVLGQSGGGGNNQITIADGGRVDVSFFQLGFTANNTLTVTGSNSLFSAASSFAIGEGGNNGSMTISNGGRVVNNDGYVGLTAGGTNSQVLITGAGSIWQSRTTLNVGSNATSQGVNSRITVSAGGTLEATSFTGGFNGTGSISNTAGIYQFPLAAPTITPNTAGSIVLSNGTISFRGITDANVFSDTGAGAVAPITFQGNNTFRLNSSSNTAAAAQNYTFDTGRGATNYVGLELVNGNSLWRSANLTIGSGGTFLASNTVGTVAALVTNLGSIEVKNSTLTWASNVVVSGIYKSDPSTNVFLNDETVTASGALAGGSGDLFDFKKSLLIQSTNRLAFQLQASDVRFSGGVAHTNSMTGVDLGSNVFAYAAAFELATNFAYGALHLGSSADTILFTSGNGAPSNALYVDWVDLLGTNSLVANLSAPSGIDVYYYAYDPRNAYLHDLTYPLSGGGFLLPMIPEPGVLALLGASGVLVWLRRRAAS